ncbi:MAG: hypothetical protein P4M11_08590 [Candidatus Pacebacteria bacterium]|nr:hypothetical protein [Candidatus Paceibacterota bacterium]
MDCMLALREPPRPFIGYPSTPRGFRSHAFVIAACLNTSFDSAKTSEELSAFSLVRRSLSQIGVKGPLIVQTKVRTEGKRGCTPSSFSRRQSEGAGLKQEAQQEIAEEEALQCLVYGLATHPENSKDRMLYQAGPSDRDKFTASAFRSICLDKGSLVILIHMMNGAVVGGYAKSEPGADGENKLFRFAEGKVTIQTEARTELKQTEDGFELGAEFGFSFKDGGLVKWLNSGAGSFNNSATDLRADRVNRIEIYGITI